MRKKIIHYKKFVELQWMVVCSSERTLRVALCTVAHTKAAIDEIGRDSARMGNMLPS